MTLDLTAIYGGVIIVLFCLVTVREIKKEYAPVITAALSVVLMSYALKRGKFLFDYIESLTTVESELYFSIIFKCFGIAIMSNIISQMCSDFGASGVCSKVDFVGKIAIIMTCMPLIDGLIDLVEGLL